ncbi:MAG TPA: hypothetical protein DC060_20855, partial [Gemmatimonadetes bacterium]|nr:hypothetical protein [Gemmatimonadota bacterium]
SFGFRRFFSLGFRRLLSAPSGYCFRLGVCCCRGRGRRSFGVSSIIGVARWGGCRPMDRAPVFIIRATLG